MYMPGTADMRTAKDMRVYLPPFMVWCIFYDLYHSLSFSLSPFPYALSSALPQLYFECFSNLIYIPFPPTNILVDMGNLFVRVSFPQLTHSSDISYSAYLD